MSSLGCFVCDTNSCSNSVVYPHVFGLRTLKKRFKHNQKKYDNSPLKKNIGNLNNNLRTGINTQYTPLYHLPYILLPGSTIKINGDYGDFNECGLYFVSVVPADLVIFKGGLQLFNEGKIILIFFLHC